jgi:hypothetical protein
MSIRFVDTLCRYTEEYAMGRFLGAKLLPELLSRFF